MPFNLVVNGFPRSILRGGATATSGQTSPFFPASPEAQSIADLFIIVLVFMAVILAIVTGLVFYVSWRYRAPGVVVGAGGTAPAMEPPQVFGHRQLEIIWTTIPFLILVVITGFMVRTMWAVDVPTDLKQKADLEIVGHQWWWEARYANGVVVANEIHIPAGRRLLAEVQSFDVIHDFWVPQLARKMDAIPGQPNRVWLQASQPGTYLGFCAEYCGTQHAWMQIRVVAHTEAEYAAWGEAAASAGSRRHRRFGGQGREAVSGSHLHQLSRGLAHGHSASHGPRPDPLRHARHPGCGSAAQHPRQTCGPGCCSRKW